jgi:8-oxo-dGTP diphosphatase
MIDVIPQFGEAETAADYILRPGGYVVITNAVGEIAVVKTPRGFFLPGGGQDEGETPEQAAIREAVEECGLYLRIRGQIGVADELVWSVSESKHYRKRCTFFSAECDRSAGDGEADHELIWMPANEAAARLTHGSQAWAVKMELRNAGEL